MLHCIAWLLCCFLVPIQLYAQQDNGGSPPENLTGVTVGDTQRDLAAMKTWDFNFDKLQFIANQPTENLEASNILATTPTKMITYKEYVEKATEVTTSITSSSKNVVAEPATPTEAVRTYDSELGGSIAVLMPTAQPLTITPVATLNASANPICNGQFTTLTTNVSTGVPPYTYQFKYRAYRIYY